MLRAEKTYDGSSCGDVHLEEVLPVVPRKGRSEKARILGDVAVAAESLAVGAEHNAIRAFLLDADAVIGEAVGGVEVEYPEQASALKHNDLVAFVLETDVCLRGVQPPVLLLCPLHFAVEFVEEPVAQEVVVNEVELAPRVVEAVAVAFAREVEPFGVPEFITLEIQITFASETVRDEADHLVQGETAVDDGGQLGQDGHVGVHLCVTEPEEEGLVPNEPGVGQHSLWVTWAGNERTLGREIQHRRLSSHRAVCWSK